MIGGTVGSSAMHVPDIAGDALGIGELYRASGDLSVGYQFKAWQVHGTLQRGLEYIAELRRPVFVDGFSADWMALFSARLDATAGARYSTGGSVLSSEGMTLETYSANARVRYALTRSLATYGEYLYYFYDLRGTALLSPGIPRRLERNSVRAGLTLWVPALRR